MTITIDLSSPRWWQYGNGRNGKNLRSKAKAILHEQGKRYCPNCEKIKPISQFGKNSKDKFGLGVYCASCRKRINRTSYQQRIESLTERRWVAKRRFVTLLGGKCARCGHDEFLSALAFHHIDPDAKEEQISVIVNKFQCRKPGISDIFIIDELDKCTLLCENCHHALHGNEWEAHWKKRDSIGWELECLPN